MNTHNYNYITYYNTKLTSIAIILFLFYLILYLIHVVYTNDEWSMEHVWDMKQLTTKNDDYQRRLKEIQKEGEVLDMIRRSKRLALSSREQKMIRLREENSILRQQLEVSCQETTQTRRHALRYIQQVNSSLKETQQILQDVMESHQQEMRRSNARLQETQSQSQETQARLQETQSESQETQARLQETQAQLQETQAQLQETLAHLQVTQAQLQETQIQLQEIQIQIQVCLLVIIDNYCHLNVPILV